MPCLPRRRILLMNPWRQQVLRSRLEQRRRCFEKKNLLKKAGLEMGKLFRKKTARLQRERRWPSRRKQPNQMIQPRRIRNHARRRPHPRARKKLLTNRRCQQHLRSWWRQNGRRPEKRSQLKKARPEMGKLLRWETARLHRSTCPGRRRPRC